MAAPQVTWLKEDNVTPFPEWKIGTIDAGSTSPSVTVLVWNNRASLAGVDAGGKEVDLSTMTNCSITTKDELGGDTGELVINKWIQSRIDSMGEGDFTEMGGLSTRVIQAGGNTTFTYTGSTTPVTTSPNAKEILGVANDGSVANSAGNFCKVSLRAKVPGTATAGNVKFLTRVAYQYV
jgi:hypothetical protein